MPDVMHIKRQRDAAEAAILKALVALEEHASVEVKSVHITRRLESSGRYRVKDVLIQYDYVIDDA